MLIRIAFLIYLSIAFLLAGTWDYQDNINKLNQTPTSEHYNAN